MKLITQNVEICVSKVVPSRKHCYVYSLTLPLSLYKLPVFLLSLLSICRFLFLLLGESPRDLPQKPSEDTQAFVSVMAHGVVRLQERGMVLSPWSLMALVLLQSPGGLSLEILTRRTAWLKGLALKFGALLDWPGKSERKVIIIIIKHQQV